MGFIGKVVFGTVWNRIFPVRTRDVDKNRRLEGLQEAVYEAQYRKLYADEIEENAVSVEKQYRSLYSNQFKAQIENIMELEERNERELREAIDRINSGTLPAKRGWMDKYPRTIEEAHRRYEAGKAFIDNQRMELDKLMAKANHKSIEAGQRAREDATRF